MGLNLEGPLILKVNKYVHMSRQMHMNENLAFLPVSLADSSDRNHVQVDQELFSFWCQGQMMCFC